jgi:hypothetical protein
VQAPALPVRLQDLQVPVHAVEQQAPCAHMPELQSRSAPQLAPMGFLPQLPLLQVLGAMQSASVVQVVLHWPVVPHMNGAHDCPVMVGQAAPVPSQRPAKVNVEPVHPAFWQTTPGA